MSQNCFNIQWKHGQCGPRWHADRIVSYRCEDTPLVHQSVLAICWRVKVNAWILYKRHYKQLALSANKRKTLAEFTSSIVSALILAGKSKPNSFRGWPTKRASIEPTWNGGKKPTLPIPIDDVRHDEVGHWPKPGIDKKRCCVRTTVGSPVQTAMFTSVWLRIVTAMCISTVNKSGLWIFLFCNVYLSYFVKMLFSH